MNKYITYSLISCFPPLISFALFYNNTLVLFLIFVILFIANFLIVYLKFIKNNKLDLNTRIKMLEYSEEIEKQVTKTQVFETIVQNIDHCILVVDNDERIVVCNDSMSSLYNIRPNTEGNFVYDHILDINIIDMLEKVNRNKESGKVYKTTARSYNNKQLEYVATSLSDPKGKRTATMIIVKDTTEIFKLQGMRRNFISNVSHELKTPLTSIKGYTETLMGEAGSMPKYREKFLGIVKHEADRLETLIADILVIQEGDEKPRLNLSDVNITEVVDTTIQLLDNQVKNDIVLTFDKPDTPIIKSTDKSKLTQVIVNIISNALKYTNEGKVNIKLEETDNEIIFTCSDTGIGIPKRHQDKIFERFYRVSRDRNSKVPGTGLGLSIVHSNLQILKGHVDVKSEQGEGTTFTITLSK